MDRQPKLFLRPPFENFARPDCARVFVQRFACLAEPAAYNSRSLSSLLPIILTPAVHRFEHFIAGRVYQIEVAPVTIDRWRAYIVRLPGVPTALMPFYGPTPVEAATLLTDWLTRAHGRASPVIGSV